MRKFTTWVQEPVVIPTWLAWFVVLFTIRHLWVPETNTVLNNIITVLELALFAVALVAWVWRVKRKFHWRNVVIYTMSENPQPKAFPTLQTTYVNGNEGEATIEIPR